ncbi:lipase family protein [Thauera sinica]|uniref:PGAP1-like protein n=1 Tax=Thauera sinica TaxID=2665146 RepID=A0ABW1ALE7_9RHOO|nr:hypothetical protein [Thauera sp. K11]ATE60739.1 hypothetical protein CCZ27_12985 [Thauera sp. K11]
MNDDNQNASADHHRQATQNIGGSAGTTAITTPEEDPRRIRLTLPTGKVLPIIFLPGIMGSHLRMSRARQEKLKRDDNIAWRPDYMFETVGRVVHDPDVRQLNFDPDETEVEVYEWTSDGERFDPKQANDKRHDNVPDTLDDIPPLLMADPEPEGLHAAKNPATASAAQKARWRGWSEVMFGTYGTLLKQLEARLNNATHGSEQINAIWDFRYVDKAVDTWGRPAGAPPPPVTADDLKALASGWCPVHAMGYNWLQSNGKQAKKIAKRIRALIRRYKDLGFECPGVILVTHSMAGLLGRALMHKDYGNLTANEVLGIVHGVMPTHGAAATYKRMRAGFEGASGINPLSRLKESIIQQVLGETGKEVTAVLANAPGALELLPNDLYGYGWLQVRDRDGNTLLKLPREPFGEEYAAIQSARKHGRPLPGPLKPNKSLEGIYTQPAEAWWRLINPDWIDPAKKYEGDKERALEAVTKRLENAMKFHGAIQDTFHPCTYAHYGDDSRHAAYGNVVWEVVAGDVARAGDPLGWTLLEDDGEGRLKVRGEQGVVLTLRLQPPAEAGDQTVPAARSAAWVRGTVLVQTGYEHQSSYEDWDAIAATLHSIVKIAVAQAAQQPESSS